MMSRQSRLIFNQLCTRSLWNFRGYAKEATQTADKDPAPYFFDRSVQSALTKLTRINLERVFRHRKIGERLKKPRYKFMTTEQLNLYRLKAQTKAEELLQMPPVVKMREEITDIYSKDYALQGYDNAKYVFTDISYGISDRNRLIAVREPNGILRAASWSERQRMNQAYFPSPFREIETPEMFQDENIARLLNEKQYEFILDRACIQYEPDDPDYQRIVKKVYNCVNSTMDFESLRSTRHFGCLVFHLLWEESIDNLLLDLLASTVIDEAVLLVQLFYKFHPTNDLIVNEVLNTGGLELIEAYVHTHSLKSQKLRQALNDHYAKMSQE